MIKPVIFLSRKHYSSTQRYSDIVSETELVSPGGGVAMCTSENCTPVLDPVHTRRSLFLLYSMRFWCIDACLNMYIELIVFQQPETELFEGLMRECFTSAS